MDRKALERIRDEPMNRIAGTSAPRLIRRGTHRLMRSRLGERLKVWIRGTGPALRYGSEYYGSGCGADVIAYFGDGPDKLYQLEQWLPALVKLNQTHAVAVVFRQRPTFEIAKSMTRLPLVLAIAQPDLMDLFAAQDYKLAIYVNNSMRNFQSMAEPSIVHVHVDHGESDKTSSVSNQLKAYDKVFVAGPAAEERCVRTLWGFDRSKLVSIGRPPLDGDFSSVLPPDPRSTVLYAPTWQGENEANNFTSVDVLGPPIVRALLESGVRVVYRPHPRVAAMGESAVLEADTMIRSMISSANAEGGAHFISTDEAILDLFEDADALIADVSSVSLDFLCLHTEKGLIITDRHNDRVRMESTSPVGSALGALSLETIHQLPEFLDEALNGEFALETRQELKRLYFGDQDASAATELFIAAVHDAIREREEP